MWVKLDIELTWPLHEVTWLLLTNQLTYFLPDDEGFVASADSNSSPDSPGQDVWVGQVLLLLFSDVTRQQPIKRTVEPGEPQILTEWGGVANMV